MKTILCLLLCTVQIYGQTSTGQEQSFPYGIVNESLQTITTPPYLTTTGMDGTQGKIPSALIAKTADVADSLATKENIANKSDSYTTSSSTTYASTKAIVDGLATKQNTLTNPITGTGTTNYIPKFTGTNSQASSALQDTGTSIYAFYDTPFSYGAVTNAAFNVGKIGTGGSFIVQTPSLNTSFSSGFAVDGTYDSGKSVINLNAFGVASGGPYNADMAFKTSTNATLSEKMRLTNTGNLLIGTTVNNGVDNLQVNGSTKTIGLTVQGTSLTDGGQLGLELTTTATGTNWTGTGFATGYTHTIGDVTPLVSTLAAVTNNLYQITYTITGRTTGSITINYGGIAISNITASGNSGPKAISTATLNIVPTTDFNGTVALSIKVISPSVATTVFKNSSGAVTNEIRAHSNNTNFSIGLNAGKSNTTGNYNSAVGYASLANNTTGGYNSAVGTSALQNNTTGGGNSAVGQSALVNNTTGNYNSAVGYASLANNTTGGGNIAVGSSALQNNTTGGSNSAVGESAGRYIANKSTPATILNNSIMLGYRTSPLADNQTNQVVIGYDATGLGSNSTVIGNSSTTTARMFGRQLVNTSTDNGIDQLQVNGTISATGGTTANQVVVKSQLDAQKPYKVYTALLSQTGTSAPTATVLENTLGGTVVWTRSGLGEYRATLNSAFVFNKTTTMTTGGLIGGGFFINSQYVSGDYVTTTTRTTLNTLADDLLTGTTIEIRVYN